MKKLLCLMLCLTLCLTSLSAMAQDMPSVADVLNQILQLQPEERAQLLDLTQTYMSAMGESMPAPPAQSAEPASFRLEGDGFATPQEAALHYLEGLKERDANKMLRSFAYETYIENFDLEAYLDQMAGWSFNLNPGLPNEVEMYRQLNTMMLYSSIAQTTKAMLLNFNWEGSDRDIYMPFSLVKEFESTGAALDFLAQDRTALLETISDIHFVDPLTIVENEKRFTSERMLKNLEKTRVRMGADELSHLAAALKFNGEDVFFACSAARYGEKWYLYSVPGHVGNALGLDMNAFPLFTLE